MWSSRVRASSTVGLATIGLLLVCTGLTASPNPRLPDIDPMTAPTIGSTTSFAVDLRAHQAAQPAEHIELAKHPERTNLRDHVTGPVLPESDPVVVSIPRINVQSALVSLGLDSSGEMGVPPDPAVAGWFSRGPTPGALGPAVIAAHVTWNGTPGVFYRLGKLRSGDRVTVTRKDGTTAVFVVSKVAQYPKERFPSREVYGAIDHAGLRLITCAGSYDESRHSYEDNIVAFARLIEVVRTAARR